MDESMAIDLRLGHIVDLYYSLIGKKAPKQLDLLEEWFPGFVVVEREEQGKIDPEYIDRDYTSANRLTLYGMKDYYEAKGAVCDIE